MADTLALISKIGFAACIGFAVLAVVFFVVFKIPDVVGELSGRKSKRSIQRQRDANEKKGNQSYRSSRTNAKRVKLTDKIQTAGSAPPKKKETEYVGTGVKPRGEPAFANATMPLDKAPFGDETVPLDEASFADETMPLDEASFADETIPLDEQPLGVETALLDKQPFGDETMPSDEMPSGAVKIEMMEEIMLIHSEEVVT